MVMRQIKYKIGIFHFILLMFFSLAACLLVSRMLRYDQHQDFVEIRIMNEENPLETDNSQKTLERFKSFYSDIKNSTEFQYNEISTQPLYSDTEGLFIHMSEDSVRKNESLSDSIGCIQVSKNVQDQMEWTCTEGSLLEESDFHLSEGAYIPILLGANYGSTYRIGETFKLSYLYQDYTFQVKGILDPSAGIRYSLFYRGKIDDTIIMPSFDMLYTPEEKDGFVSELLHYSNKTCGYILVDTDKYKQTEQMFSEWFEKYNFNDYTWSTDSVYLSYLHLGINLKLIRYFSAAVFLVSTAAFVKLLLLLKKRKSNS